MMLFPDKLNDSTLTQPFSLFVEEISVNGIDNGSTEISISYDERGRPLLSLGNFFSASMGVLDDDIEVRYKSNSEPWPILITKRTFSTDHPTPIVEARLAREPLVLVDSQFSKRFEAVLLSVPRFRSKQIALFDINGVKFEIEPSKSEEGASCLIRSDIDLKASDPLKPLGTFRDFLTFAKGCHCGLGNLFAYGENDTIAFRLLGFSPSDYEKRELNWFDLEIQHYLPDIFLLFSKASSDETTRWALRQTINFYRASNASRNVSLEISIIAAQSALEAIVNFVLEHRAGWSKSMMKNRTVGFSEKHRAAAYHFGIHGDLLSQSPELKKFSKNNGDIDIFEIISRFRNKLVHQDIKNSHILS